jgi:hypothetical protein
VLAKVSGTQHEHLTWLNSQKKFAGKYDYTESINMKPGEYKLYQVVPGVYSIVDFYLDRNHTTYSANDKGRAVNEQMLANSRSLWGAFTATAGRITYIGDLNFYTDNGVKLDSNLHVDKATEFIHKNYINISNVESIMVNHAAK